MECPGQHLPEFSADSPDRHSGRCHRHAGKLCALLRHPGRHLPAADSVHSVHSPADRQRSSADHPEPALLYRQPGGSLLPDGLPAAPAGAEPEALRAYHSAACQIGPEEAVMTNQFQAKTALFHLQSTEEGYIYI